MESKGVSGRLSLDMGKLYFCLLTFLLVSCGDKEQKSTADDPSRTPISEFGFDDALTDLSRVFSFTANRNEDTKILDNRVSRTRINGSCLSESGNRLDFDEIEISSNESPVGAIFTAEFLLDIYKTNATYYCELYIHALDRVGRLVPETETGVLKIKLPRDVHFGINLSNYEQIKNSRYVMTDLHSAQVEVKPFGNFGDPREEVELKLICDNGSEKLEKSSVFRKGETITNMFADEPFTIMRPLRNMLVMSRWLDTKNGSCIITNGLEGTPYMLWSHVIDYLNEDR